MTNLSTLLRDEAPFFLHLTAEHLLISLSAIVIATIVGVLLGIFISEYRKYAAWLLGAVNMLYTIPSIALLGFFISITGVGNLTALIALILYALLPIIRSTYTGITHINPLIIEAAEAMGSTRWQLLYKIKLPLALPVLMSGIRNMVTMTIALAGIASFVGAGGLGVAIYRGITTNNSAMTLVGSVLIALLALGLDFFLEKIEKRLVNREVAHKRNPLKLVGVGVLALLITLFFVLSPKKTKDIHIATKPMTESYILGQMLALLIEQDTGLSVRLTNGVGGGTSNIHPAMLRGGFDIYPEYTGTSWEAVLKYKDPYQDDKFTILEDAYKKQYGLEWANLYGFNNTYGLAVSKQVAQQYQLKTFTDLAKVSHQLIFGAEYDFFEREDGYKQLQEVYGIHFGKVIDMDIGLKYQAIRDKKIDAMVVFTTDGQLSVSEVVVLQDDRNLYPSYKAGTVVRTELLTTYPALRITLKKLNNLIDDATMAHLNFLVETERKRPEEVAKNYLLQKGLLHPQQ
ncbi:glycine betaine ABC transporter substrate-binding protein [Capnocytophaga gingivalis]|uniref:ABC transporter permease/substrate-binding protein n=1 Tax=Capnocytophaga gingivalis TaxID=1017 RepID=UPI0028EE65C5|nr:glycine betaine ABC transporter substrate-binding protein [Capnocytophaga gingivalis]